MAVLWTSTKSRADIDSEDGLLVKTPTLKRPDKPIKGLAQQKTFLTIRQL